MERKITCLNGTINSTFGSFFIMKASGHKVLKRCSLEYATKNEPFLTHGKTRVEQ